jgi:uncharacterized protein (DUF2252 family)
MAPKEDGKGGLGPAVLHDNTATPRDGRRARGEALRAAISHVSHAGWEVAPKRQDPVELLASSDSWRRPELVPIRYGRMSHSPFTFFRGSAAVMAADLVNTKQIKVKVQACGDCHALNFGAFATPERNIVFDLNDFDETLPAPWEWDLKRLTVSLVLIARDNGLKAKIEGEAVEACVRAYRTRMQEFSKMAILDIWYAKVDWESVLQDAPDKALKATLADQLKKAQKQTTMYHTFPKLTQQQDGSHVIKDNYPLIYHPQDDPKFQDRMTRGFELYKSSLQEDKQRLLDRYKLVDVAIKVVGVGSVGTTCAIALLLGRDEVDPLILQIKEARESVLEPHVGRSEFDNHGQRVVTGQRIVQSASDIFLGWMRLEDGRDFYVRQLRDTKVKLETESWTAKQLVGMAEVLGAVLAKAHARSGDSATIAGYLGDDDGFDRAVADFSTAYANQVEKDHAALTAAIRSGRIKADASV